MYKNILIPTDGSSHSRKAIVAGVKLAKLAGAKVTGLFAAPPATPVVYKNYLPVGYMTAQQHSALIKKAAAKYLDVIVQEARKAEVRCETLCVTSDFPAETIIATATNKKCDLIVMATHGRGGISKVLLGSQTQKVITSAKVSVLVSR